MKEKRKGLHRAGLMFWVALVCSPVASWAQGKACLLEGDLTIAGQRVVIKDCAENRGLPEPSFTQACQSMANPFNDPKYAGKVTYMAACPRPAPARCENAMGGQVSFFYYKRDRESLDASKSGCAAFGGRWVE
jgi:hypothetical protein